MSGTAAEVRERFPFATFGPPCSEADLKRAEAALGHPIPSVLSELYLSFDGFRGLMNAWFLLPLSDEPAGQDSLVGTNRFFREGFEFPQQLMKICLFYGDDGVGALWGLKEGLPGKIILWDAEWGEDFEVLDGSILDVWLRRKLEYDRLIQNLD